MYFCCRDLSPKSEIEKNAFETWFFIVRYYLNTLMSFTIVPCIKYNIVKQFEQQKKNN